MPRLNHSTVVAYLALFVALGGTSYAATQLDRNSVRSKHIRNGQVTRADLARNAVNSSKVGDGSLLAQDFAAGQLPQGARGAQGLQGAQGPQGIQGPAGVIGDITVQRANVNLPAGPGANQPGAEIDGFATCPAGQRIIGGSVNTSSPAGATVLISRPATDTVGNGGIPDNGDAFAAWKGTARTETNVAASMRVFAFCAQTP